MNGTRDLAHVAATPMMRGLSPQQRGRVILEQAQADLLRPLWQAALGDGARGEEPCSCSNASIAAQSLSWLWSEDSMVDGKVPAGFRMQPAQDRTAGSAAPVISTDPQAGENRSSTIVGLGRNATHGAAIAAAAERTGIPPAALAAVIDAEAARNRDGSWNVMSRNPRSSAAGLGQFLSGTWLGLARKPGSWLHQQAARNGWLTASGQVDTVHRAELLRLRYDPQAAIEGVADYAANNLVLMKRRRLLTGGDSTSVARAIYLAHHLGPGDAAHFLGRGLGQERADMLLAAQIGREEASRRIAGHGNAVSAHRAWLTGYIDARIRPDNYSARI